MAKRKADTSVGYVEPSMTLVLGVKEGEWKEIKQYRDEGIFFQVGTSLCLFAMSLLVTLLTCKIELIIERILWISLGASFGVGFLLICLWHVEKKKKNNVIKKVEGRAREKYGDDIDL